MKGSLWKIQVVLRLSHLNWMNSEGKEGQDKAVRITMREKSSSGRERAPPGLSIRHGKGHRVFVRL